MASLHLDRLPRTVTPGEVAGFVRRVGKLDAVGPVALRGTGAVVDVPDAVAARLVAALDGATFRDYPVRVRLAAPVGRGSSDAAANHFRHLVHLLDREAAAERRQAKERADQPGDGASLTGLTVRAEDPGLGGRLVLTLGRSAPAPLPPDRLQPGSPVTLTQTKTAKPVSVRGVVSDRAERTIQVAVDPGVDLPDGAAWRLDLTFDDAARQRMVAALHRAASAEHDRLAELRSVLLSERPPRPSPDVPPDPATPLNGPQEDAVRFALAAADVAVIHGPPGTGKTTTLVALIRRAVARGETVLACAPSNAAVDNLLEKLLAGGELPVRIGHPARVAEALRGRALDVLVEAHPDARQARKFAREAHALFRRADKWTKAQPAPGEKAALRNEARDLLAVARRTEQLAVERVLAGARVVCGTLTGIDSNVLGQRRFDLCVIDEACQSTEPACWVPLSRVGRLVLAGDPCQLPPTVVSREAAEDGLAVSLMERVMTDFGSNVSRLLTVQYRMHDAIMTFPSGEFYGGRLEAHESVAGHTLAGLPGVTATDLTTVPVRFVDTAGAGYDEEPEPDTASRRNPREADLVAKYVRQLLAAGVPAADVAVVTPYSGQVRLVGERLAGTGVEVDSVDGFQGREKEAVVMSLVRSNPEGEIGFLADVRRTNVALTRARRLVVVVGDSATLAGHDFYKRLLDHFDGTGAWASVWDEAE